MKKADIGVNDVSDVVEIMKLNMKSQTTQFKHFLIYQIGACNRPSKVEVDNRAEPLKGISKYHSIWITEDGELRGSVLSCEDCTVKWRCGKCRSKSLSSSSFQCFDMFENIQFKGRRVQTQFQNAQVKYYCIAPDIEI